MMVSTAVVDLKRSSSPMPRTTEHPHHNPPRTARLPYWPALDGLRALAVGAVLLYHADMPWLPGGFLGVEIFFTLSGYLITTLLLAEWGVGGRIDLAAFWLRRARRLLPALFILIAGVMAFAVLLLPDEVARLRGDALAAVGYALNWRLVFEQRPYFETVGRPPLLQHLWSLAVEEQFYLLWPLVFVAGMRRLGRGGMLFAACAGAVASTVLMALLFEPDGDPSRIYYGTDTRMAGFLAGAALAFVRTPVRWPVTLAPHGRLSAWRRKGPWDGGGMATALVLDSFGLMALGMLAWRMVVVDEFQPRLYQGGFAAVAILAVIVVAAASDQRARLLPPLLGWRPLRWVGLRSYGIYLWHWPICMLTRPQLDVSLDGAPLLALRLAATLALAELSYRCVELPIRSGALGRAWRRLSSSRGAERWRLGARWVSAAAVSLVAALALGVAAVEARPPQVPEYLAGAAVEAETLNGQPLGLGAQATLPTIAPIESAAVAPPAPSPTTVATQLASAEHELATPAVADLAGERARSDQAAGVASATTSAAPLATDSPAATPRATAPLILPPATQVAAVPPAATQPLATAPLLFLHATQSAAVPPAPQIAAGRVLAIGDSVMIGAAKQLGRLIGAIEVDAKVSRQAKAAIKLVSERREAGQLGDVVIIHIGSNGSFSARQFDDLMAQLADVRRVVVLTVKVPRRWEGPNNNVIVEGVKRYPNAVLVDWHAASADHPELFWRDGIHLQPAGAILYADLIAAAVNAP
jgi:peptidoglycan/LPS O-acetylase OafA/YrhL